MRKKNTDTSVRTEKRENKPSLPPSKVETRKRDDGTESYWLDGRYNLGGPLGNVRGPYQSRESAEEMARVDDLVAKAGIKRGDRFKLLMKRWVVNKKTQKMEQKEVWERPEVTFYAIENARFVVCSINYDPSETHPEWALMTTDKGGMGSIIEIRRVGSPKKRSKA